VILKGFLQNDFGSEVVRNNKTIRD